MGSNPFYSSYNKNAMLVAVISLLLITILMMLLHFFAKWRFERLYSKREPPPLSSSLAVLTLRDPFGPQDDVGHDLEPSLVASLPIFVYRLPCGECKNRVVCVVCLNTMEEEEKGRILPRCGHCFHVGCIDKWLLSYSSCPLCRAPMEDSTTGVVKLVVEEVSEEQSPTLPDPVEDTNLSPENIVAFVDIPLDSSPSPPSLSSSLYSSSSSSSWKRMLSRDTTESKVHPSNQVGKLKFSVRK